MAPSQPDREQARGGSYTPIALVILSGTWGSTLFCAVWALPGAVHYAAIVRFVA